MTVLLSCQELGHSFGSGPLFSDLSLGVHEGERLGLIGANGSGKSTLLKILAGQIDPQDGEVIRRRHLKVAYVPQTDGFAPNKTARDCLREYFNQSATTNDDADDLTNIAVSKIELMSPDEPVNSLSGGWRKRLALAGGLVSNPDVLLLDEPTNHLDIEGILWLEKELARASFAVVMISHDRRFLQNTVNKLAEINKMYDGGVFNSKGRYSDFLIQRAAYMEEQKSIADSLANKVRREAEWLRRSPKARTTKSQARVDAAEIMQAELAERRQRANQQKVNLDISGSGRQTKRLISLENVSYAIADRPLITNLSLALRPGSRLGLLGKNGAGKSSLINIMAGRLSPASGSVSQAEELKISYFEQDRSSLDQTITLKAALCESGDSVVFRGRQIHVVSWAKRFLFRPEQLNLEVNRLSGGEQARILIARFMLQDADVIFMDEPTNDLDIETLDVLEESLQDFAGAVVLVSHDRYFLEKLCDQFVGINGEGASQLYASIDQWLTSLQSASPDIAPTTHEKIRGKPSSKKKKLGYIEQRELDSMEEAILIAEEQRDLAKAALEDPAVATDSEKLVQASSTLEEAQNKVDNLYARWEELEEKAKRLAEDN